ncbi:serine hydrolase [Flammeovirga sp. EKP202]|uniref:serine hydrolase domain-containing protein n=1 Tax=Flammeovirga sp. EKP202 TaxID=2770592 RepID=UPI001660045C|nr:serine hydrolase domain-containing protein [Flammeovirga sp. EKP202]MBD0402627.1 serine hydrolase [Flammeovirga sp. EKP202]
MNKTLFILLLFSFISCKSKKTDNETTKALTNELQKISETGLIKGFSVAIVDDKDVLYQRGFGYSNEEKKTPYTTQTIQNIGSVSKVVIGLSLLKAQELGMLHFNDPINKYLPFKVFNPAFPGEVITIKHLANHTSSILDTKFYDENVYVLKEDTDSVENEQLKGAFQPADTYIPMPEFLKKLLSEEGDWYLKEGFAEFKPGENFAYSNVGAALAAYILEIASGQSYPEFTKQYIFEPLKMSSSGWSFETVDLSKHSTLYFGENELPLYRLQSYPDGGLLTSANDLALLLKELIKGQSSKGSLLQPESYEALFGKRTIVQLADTVKKENPVFSVKYDSNLFMGSTSSGFYGHTGGDPGIVSLFFFDADRKVGRLIIVNTHIDGSKEAVLNELWTIWEKLDEYKVKLIN